MPANQALLCMFGGILIRHYIDADQSETCTLWSLSACRRLQICVWMCMCPCALLIGELVRVFALRKVEKVSWNWPRREIRPSCTMLNNSLIPTFPCVIHQTIHMGVNCRHRHKSSFSSGLKLSQTVNHCKAVWQVSLLDPCKTLMMLRAPWNLFYFSANSLFFSKFLTHSGMTARPKKLLPNSLTFCWLIQQLSVWLYKHPKKKCVVIAKHVCVFASLT